MKQLLIIMMFFFALELQARDLFDVMGCYETLSINDHPVEMGPSYEDSLTIFEYRESSVFFHLETRGPLKSFQFVLFTGSSGNWYSYHSFIGFSDFGITRVSENKMQYEVEENILMKNSGWRLEKVDHSMAINFVDYDEYLMGHATFESTERQMSGEKRFKLKPVPCP